MGALMYISRSLVVSIQFLFLSLRLYPSIPCSLSRLSRLSHHRRCCCLSHRIWHISPSLTSSTRLYYSSPSRLLSLYASLLLQNCCPDSRLETCGRPLTTSTVLVHILPSTSRTSAVPATRGIYPLLACTILPSFPASRSRLPLTFTLSRRVPTVSTSPAWIASLLQLVIYSPPPIVLPLAHLDLSSSSSIALDLPLSLSLPLLYSFQLIMRSTYTLVHTTAAARVGGCIYPRPDLLYRVSSCLPSSYVPWFWNRFSSGQLACCGSQLSLAGRRVDRGTIDST